MAKAKVGDLKDGSSIFYEDITPTWSGSIDALILLIESGTPKSREFAKTELRRLARIADRHINHEV
jgi:hypothetical protein